MTNNISVIKEERKVILSDELLEKIMYLLKNNNYYNYKGVNEKELSYSSFSDVTNYIINRGELSLEYIPDSDLEYGISIDNLVELKDKYLLLNPPKQNDLWFKYLRKDKINEFVELIDIIYEITIEKERYYLIRDLIKAKEDTIINMKYFMNDEEIKKFNDEYEFAISKRDVGKMQELLNNIQELILKEWNNYFENLDEMTDESFKFIGHSTHQTKFDKDFYSRYVSCSLYTEDVNDTYASPFGFIMGPSNIVGASSTDMYVNNYADGQESLLHYSTLRKIDHPKRIIVECQKQKQDNLKNELKKGVYSEIVKDGFEPIGIFCFTDGSKGFNWNYRYAMELQKSFPHLKVKVFDIMKKKTGIELDEMKLNLINNLKNKFTSFTYDIEMNNLSRYDLFFDKFDKLKRIGEYTEDDIENIFKYNIELLSIFDKEPKELFNGKYNDIEIKYILGKNINYNIDYILKGEITPYSLNKLKELNDYKGKLNNYYSGLEEFIELLSKIEVTKEMIEEIKKIDSLNFYTMSKCLIDIILKSLNSKEEQIKYEINRYKNRYMELKNEKEQRQKIEKEYEFYSKINNYSYYVNLIKIEDRDLNEQITENKLEYTNYIEERNKLINQVSVLTTRKNELFSSKYQDSNEYKEINFNIENLEKERELLKKHPVINGLKIRDKNKMIDILRKSHKSREKNYDMDKQDKINNINNKINELKYKLDSLEERLMINQERKNELQLEMKNLQTKIYEYFSCHSILDINKVREEAQIFITNYDYSNSYFLQNIEEEISKIQAALLNQNNNLNDIQKEKNTFGRF